MVKKVQREPLMPIWGPQNVCIGRRPPLSLRSHKETPAEAPPYLRASFRENLKNQHKDSCLDYSSLHASCKVTAPTAHCICTGNLDGSQRMCINPTPRGARRSSLITHILWHDKPGAPTNQEPGSQKRYDTYTLPRPNEVAPYLVLGQ